MIIQYPRSFRTGQFWQISSYFLSC